MYGSYGSYSSMGSTYIASAPMDMGASTLRSANDHDASCAFPSWPRRSSLSDSDRDERPTSYLSDDDLYLSNDPFSNDDSHSVSSSSSSAGSACASPPTTALTGGPVVQLTELEIMEQERERHATQREFVRNLLTTERERRRQQAARKQQAMRRSSPTKKNGKGNKMAPIAE